jgi:hypothetical protein
MIAAIAMSALSVGALLELALAAAIRGRAERRRDTTAASVVDLTATADLAAAAGAAAVAPAGGQSQR